MKLCNIICFSIDNFLHGKFYRFPHKESQCVIVTLEYKYHRVTDEIVFEQIMIRLYIFFSSETFVLFFTRYHL
jgi:hypothetical protein